MKVFMTEDKRHRAYYSYGQFHYLNDEGKIEACERALIIDVDDEVVHRNEMTKFLIFQNESFNFDLKYEYSYAIGFKRIKKIYSYHINKISHYDVFLTINGECIPIAMFPFLYKGDKTIFNGKELDTLEVKFNIGQYVKFKVKEKDFNGFITKFKFSAKNLPQAFIKCNDNKNRSVNINDLKLAKANLSNLKESLDHIPDTIVDNFKFTLQNSKFQKLIVSIIEKDGESIKVISCSNCGSQIKIPYFGGNIECKECTQQHIVIDEASNLFIIPEPPSKNAYCFDEARCCNNCGLFDFEYGRQGKRSTGYCRTHNYCVLAHNTCESWFPSNEHKMSQHLKSQTTNLGMGVDRFVDRPAHLVYTKEDHERNKKYSKEYNKNYKNAYKWFIEQCKKKVK